MSMKQEMFLQLELRRLGASQHNKTVGKSSHFNIARQGMTLYMPTVVANYTVKKSFVMIFMSFIYFVPLLPLCTEVPVSTLICLLRSKAQPSLDASSFLTSQNPLWDVVKDCMHFRSH